MKHRQVSNGRITNYHYTAHRIDSVSYDDALTNIYIYDQYGRIDSLYDESGVMCYEYGNMGEVTKETRIYALPFLPQPLALSTLFEYDSWGRILNITYPDNEIVNYDYDLGGKLFRMSNYLDSIKYDKFGAKISQKCGNGIKTDYTYDNITRRLSSIQTTDNNTTLSSINYTYDLVGNVTQVTSICPWLQNQSFTETFSYDSTDQLISANETQSYQLAVNYGNWGKIMQYDIAQTDMLNNATETHSRSFSYPVANYSTAQTSFAPVTQTGDEQVNLTYGINGSLRKREIQTPNPHIEYYLFNSQANLKAYSDDIIDFAYYGYNAANTRTYKLSMFNTNQWINGQQEPLNMQLQQAMFYPNTYLNFNGNGEYTKHYYNGMERIASRLGDNTITIALNNNILEDRKLQAEDRFREEILELISETTQVDLPPFIDVNTLQPTGTPNDIYYYHINHLGNTAYVTDQNQNITQGFLYAPFGEITTEYNINFGNNVIPKYSFNAKELDEETGMYYYEARYYAPPVFISRDPLMSEKPWLTPYHYCSNNPIGRVDPSGCEDDEWEINSCGNVVKHIKTKEHDAFYMVDDNGNRMEGKSCEFEYGTIEKHIQRSYAYKGNKGVYDVFQIRGDENGENFFKFFSNVVAEQGIEVSHIKCGIDGKKGLNFVSTAHFKPYYEIRENGDVYKIAAEPSSTYLWNDRLQYGYTVRAINHSHPLSVDPSGSDLQFAYRIRHIYSNIKKAPAPNFNLFYVKENRYIPF